MTNKTEHFYVVSETELQDLIQAVYDRQAADDFQFTEVSIQQAISEMNKCLATCRAREVRFIGAADQGNSLMLWGEVKK